MQVEEALAKYFGFDAFRPNQRGIVDALMAGRDVLAVMPTGAGKSICYQVPALCLAGTCLVVSPLISLMKDQVNALEQAGVRAAYLNSSLPARDRAQVAGRMVRGELDLLYVAPERLAAPDFVETCTMHPPALVAVDEAHCISQWGQDFRPSYTRIRGFLEQLPLRPPVGAFTATATQSVRDDIAASLALQNPHIVVASFDRPNLRFEVRRKRDKDSELLDICRTHAGKSGIVYCSSRRAVEEVCDFLVESGFKATRYHAGLGAGERKANQDAFVFDTADIIVATNAFGMGIDKSNVGFVVHYNMPLDVESYYQEAGRAGRDGEPADCILLYAKRDVQTCRFLIERSNEEAEDVDFQTRRALLERAQERLKLMTFYATTNDCLRGYILKYFGERPGAYCGSCSNCETKFEEVDATREAQVLISCVYRLRERHRTLGRTAIVDIVRGAKNARTLESGFDTLSTYGLMADVSAKRTRFILDSLIERGVLDQTTGQYPVVVFTDESGRFLHDKETFSIKVPKERAPAAKQSAKSRNVVVGEDVDLALYEHLRKLRLQIATEEDVAAFIVFSNASLVDMCRKLPTTPAEFLQVEGVGERKAQRYGERFLAAIASYTNTAALASREEIESDKS